MIEQVTLNRPNLRRPFPLDLRQALTGARVTALGRRAKYGLLHTDRDRTLVFHLGMSGRWRIDPETPDPHDHLVLDTADHRFALCDPRRFGSVDLIDTPALEEWPQFAAMGPEPLGDGLTATVLWNATRGRKTAIKQLLLDQKIVAGLGNIYVCEALFRAGISPRRAGARVTKPMFERLVPEIRSVLEQSIRDGGSSLRDYAKPDGELGYFATRFQVYGREAEPCIGCASPVKRVVQGGRSTWYCPRCQK